MGFFNKKAVLLLSILTMISAIGLDSFAAELQKDETLKLTRSDVVKMAVDHSHDMSLMDQNIDDLWDSYNGQVQRWRLMQQQLETFDDYQKLIDKKNRGELLDELELFQFNMYFAMYGVTPPQLAPVDKFNNYIKVGEFPCQQLYNATENLKLQRKLAEASLKSGINGLFENLLQMNNELSVQNEYYNNILEQNEQMHKKYESGLISELDLLSSDIGLSQQKLMIDMIKRNNENIEITLKSQIGIPMDQQVIFESPKSELTLLLHSSYSFYLESALANRAEVVMARNGLKLKQRELEVVRQYFPDDKLTERIEAQVAADEAANELDNVVNSVTIDITRGYKDVLSKYNDVILSTSNRVNARRQFDNAELYYNKGLITYFDFQSAQTALNKSEIDYVNAVYNYNNSVRKIIEASGIGPAYSGAGGI